MVNNNRFCVNQMNRLKDREKIVQYLSSVINSEQTRFFVIEG